MTIEQLLALLLAGGLGAILTALANGYKVRADARREDRKQVVDARSAEIGSLTALLGQLGLSAETVIKIQEAQIQSLTAQNKTLQERIIQETEDYKARLDAQGAAIVEYDRRFDRILEQLRAAEFHNTAFKAQLAELRDKMIGVEAKLSDVESERDALREEFRRVRDENFALRNKLQIAEALVYTMQEGESAEDLIDLINRGT